MASTELTSNLPQRLRANRKVMDRTCTSCAGAFGLAEEVYRCAACDGYHHLACWDAAGTCPRQADASPAPSLAPALAAPPAPTVSAPGARAAQPLTKIAENERTCPLCAKVIKKAAMKCRFCGALLHPLLILQHEQENIPDDVLAQARDNANKAVWCGVLGVFLFFAPIVALMAIPIVAPTAIAAGHEALRALRRHPAYVTPLRGRARFGIAMGWIGLTIFLLTMISKCS